MTWKKTSTTSQRLKEIMDIKHLKQADLARLTGLGKGGISNYVTGRYEPKSDVINKLATALNCSEMWLWGYDVPMEKTKSAQINKDSLSEEEKTLLELFNKVPAEQQKLVIQMIKAALSNT